MTETAQQFGPRLHAALFIADLEHDALGLRLNRDLLAGDLVEDDVFARRRCGEYSYSGLGAFQVRRRLHPAKAAAFHLENIEWRNHGWFEAVSEHSCPFMSINTINRAGITRRCEPHPGSLDSGNSVLLRGCGLGRSGQS